MTHPRKNALLSIPFLAASLALAACGGDGTINGIEGVPLAELDQSGNPPTELVLAGASQVIITEGDTLSIKVEGDKDAAAALRFVRDGEMLGIAQEDADWDDMDDVIVRITMPAPEELVIAGSGSIKAETLAQEAELVIGGSGSLAVAEIESESLEVVVGGSGSVKGAGTVKELDVSIGGSGSARLDKLNAEEADINIGGSGSVKLQSDGNVTATIAGSGSVSVTGDANCEEQSFGSGSLTCKPGA